MNLPTQPGRYIAKPANYAIEPSDDPNKQTVAWACVYDLLHFYDRSNNEWVDVSQDAMQITGYHYVIKSDGQPNTTQINQLRSALGWDGRSLAGLETDNWVGLEVQIQVDSEVYNNKQRMKVNWIDPRDANPAGGGGVKRAEAGVVQSLDAKYGPMLRALGSSNGNGNGTKPPANNTAANAIDVAKRKAWDAYKAKFPKSPTDELQEAFKHVCKGYDPNREPKSFTAADWIKVQKKIEEPENPVEQEPVFAADDIPF